MVFTRDNPSNIRLHLLLILILAATLRLWFAWDNPYTGDEVTSVLNASMYRLSYFDHISYDIRPAQDYQDMLQYTGEYGLSDLITHFAKNSRGHPPFYYAVLHGVIRFIGNDTTLIRMVSIICSMACVWFAFRIGELLAGQKAGLLSALFMAIAPFTVFYSIMVRPYPLSSAIALGTTLMVLRLIKHDEFNLSNPRVYVFAALSALGLYTIYHYALTIIFQFVLLLVSWRFNRTHFIRLCVTGGVLLLLMMPWITALSTHVDYVRGDTQPHNGPNESIWVVIKTLAHMNFTAFFSLPLLTNESPPWLMRALRIGLFLGVFLLVGIGFFRGCTDGPKWPLALAFAAYYAANLGLDLATNTHTLSMEKLQFLPVSFSLIFIAAATTRSISTGLHRVPLWPVVALLLIPGTLHTCITKPRYEDPFTLPEIKAQVAQHTADNQSFLFMSNTHSERQLFTSVSVIPKHGDYFIFRKKFFPDNMAQLHSLEKYDLLFFCNFFARGFETYVYTPEELGRLSAHFADQGFERFQPEQIDPVNSVDHLLIFRRIGSAP